MRASSILVGFLLVSIPAHALVRTIMVDDTTMAEVHLAMGRSTVLHFLEKPTKVVVGNQNYFNIEFTGNDVTIQPQAMVSSNLFVYGEYRRYGFILRVSGGERYDDLLQIRWKSRFVLPRAIPTIATVKPKATPKILNIKLRKVFRLSDLYVIEFEIRDKIAISSKDIVTSVIQNKKEVPIREMVFDKDHAEVLNGRVFVRLTNKAGVLLKIKIGDRRSQLNISQSHFK